MHRFKHVLALVILGTTFPAAAQAERFLAYFEIYSVDSSAIATIATDGEEKPLPLNNAPGQLYVQTSGVLRVGETLITLGKTQDITDPGWLLFPESSAGQRTTPLPGSRVTTSPPARVQLLSMPSTILTTSHTAAIDFGSRIDAKLLEHTNGTVTYDLSVTIRNLREPEPVPVFETSEHTANVTAGVDDLSAFAVPWTEDPGHVMLILLRVRDEHHPRPAEFNVETKFVQIQGKPDWTWWTQPFSGAFDYKEGAGRVFGPIDATGFWKDIDFARIGFPGVPVNDPTIISSPRVNWVLDHRERTQNGTSGGTLFKLLWAPSSPDQSVPGGRFVSVIDHLEALYNSLSERPIETVWENLASKALIAMSDMRFDKNGELIIPSLDQGDGLLMTVEARSTEQPGVYRLDQGLLVHKKKMVRSRGSWKWGDGLIRGQFVCDYEVKDGATTAFMMPIKDDEFLLAVSTFTLIPQEQTDTALFSRPYNVDMKAMLVEGTPDWEAINALDVPDALEHRDGSPIIFWPQNPYGFWNLDKMESQPQRFYFKNIAAAKLVWASPVGSVGNSFWTTEPNVLSPTGYKVPFTDEIEAKKKHLLGVQMPDHTQPADPRPRGILAAYEAAEAKTPGRTPPRLDEFIQFQLPTDLAETEPAAGDALFYARSDVSFKPHDNLLTVYLFPAGDSKFFLVLSRFTMNSGISLATRGWHG